MPTYDYRCNACGHEFELFQAMSDKPLRKCPDCGKLKLERLIGTGAGVIFKGGGFYETDYRSESYKKAAEAEKNSSEGASSDSKKSDTKTTETKAAKPTNDKKPAAKKKSDD
ncbi:MAG: zinc ribbon domain-containing protein [Phycisphaeraceae bacterium]|nr:zinc ribbon domain-containing protein [Phycisphaeraceae bacterium]MCB9847999.1 zinc ribbon domain-containing protein [Phycisphaeraceae bacterium]